MAHSHLFRFHVDYLKCWAERVRVAEQVVAEQGEEGAD